jgi:hypothetical protein
MKSSGEAETDLGLLALSGRGLVIILSAVISKHLGHGDRASREVRVVVQALPHLHANSTDVTQAMQQLLMIGMKAATVTTHCAPHRIEATV